MKGAQRVVPGCGIPCCFGLRSVTDIPRGSVCLDLAWHRHEGVVPV